jgi:hypothetical protein
MMKRKPYWEMTAKELAAATRQFDEPFAADASRPLTEAERRRWQRAKKKRGRPRTGLGVRRISVSMEQGLLRQVTALAKKRHISRSQLLAEAVTSVLVREAKREPER